MGAVGRDIRDARRRAHPGEETERSRSGGGRAGVRAPGRQAASSAGRAGKQASAKSAANPARAGEEAPETAHRGRSASSRASGGSRASASRPADSRASSRRNETRRPASLRFATRRSVVVQGSNGPRQISLRLLTILLFAALAVIIVTPTLANYLDRQHELRELKSELATVQEHNEELAKEIELWKDDDYVRSQARERLGYVMPGQKLYVVTDSSKGTAQEQLERKVASLNRDRRAATPWYSTMWDSLKAAGQTDASEDPDDTPIIDDEPEQEGQ